jgi:hypothetical protein
MGERKNNINGRVLVHLSLPEFKNLIEEKHIMAAFWKLKHISAQTSEIFFNVFWLVN